MDGQTIQIQTVETHRELKKFIKFQWRVYRGDPYWVPPLISEQYKVLGSDNPFWQHAEKVLFIAKRGNQIVGRIAGIIDYNYIEFQENKTGFFGFYEFLPDFEVAQRLLDTVRGWLKGKGMDTMMGPVNPSTNNIMGCLIEGFDVSPMLMTPYNPRYYKDSLERYGFVKAKELYSYIMLVDAAPLSRLEMLESRVREKYPGFKIKPVNVDDFENEVNRIAEVYNSAWEKNWGFVPWTREEFTYIAKGMKSVIVKDLALFAKIDEKVIGMLIAVPDFNQVLIKLNGRLTPWGIIKYFYYRTMISQCRLMILGVKKEYRKKGIEGALYYEATKAAHNLGYTRCEFSWILEDNILTQRAAEMMGGRLYKKYRVYEMEI